MAGLCLVMILCAEKNEAGRDITEFYETTKGKDGKEKEKYKGWEGKIIPKSLIERAFFAEERAEIEALRAEAEENQGYLAEWIEEQSGEDGILSGSDGDDSEEGEERLNLLMISPRIPAGAKLY